MICNTTKQGCSIGDCVCDERCFLDYDARNKFAATEFIVTLLPLSVCLFALVWTAAEIGRRFRKGKTGTPALFLLFVNLGSTCIRVVSLSFAISFLNTCDNLSEGIMLVLIRLPHVGYITCALVVLGVWHDTVAQVRKVSKSTRAIALHNMRRRLCLSIGVLLTVQCPLILKIAISPDTAMIDPIVTFTTGVYVLFLTVGGAFYGYKLTSLISKLQKSTNADLLTAAKRVKLQVLTLVGIGCGVIVAIVGFAAFNSTYISHLVFRVQISMEEGFLSLILIFAVKSKKKSMNSSFYNKEYELSSPGSSFKKPKNQPWATIKQLVGVTRAKPEDTLSNEPESQKGVNRVSMKIDDELGIANFANLQGMVPDPTLNRLTPTTQYTSFHRNRTES